MTMHTKLRLEERADEATDAAATQTNEMRSALAQALGCSEHELTERAKQLKTCNGRTAQVGGTTYHSLGRVAIRPVPQMFGQGATRRDGWVDYTTGRDAAVGDAPEKNPEGPMVFWGPEFRAREKRPTAQPPRQLRPRVLGGDEVASQSPEGGAAPGVPGDGDVGGGSG